MLPQSGDIRDQSLKWSKIDRKFACFAPPPIFWRGAAPEFLDLHYKIDIGSDHVAKFRGDRPRELAKKTSKIEDLPLLRTGGLIIIFKSKLDENFINEPLRQQMCIGVGL